MKFVQILSKLLVLTSLICCNKKSQINSHETEIPLKYASGFKISKIENFTKVTINKPYKNSEKAYEYLLVPKTALVPKTFNSVTIIRTPIERIVVTSSTHIPFLELLNEEESLVGFPNTDYISSTKTRQLIDQGAVINLGKEQNINTEILFKTEPELVMSFAVNKPNKSLLNIQKTGVPILLNGDWLEKTPLGRVEWIKLFGLLYQKKSKADSLFKQIEFEYLSAKKLALKAKHQPKIMSGSIFQNTWYSPAGDSFMGTYFKDAGINYLWKDSKGTGSLALGFENVLEKAENADFWIGCGTFATKTELLETNPHYKQFKSFKNNVYTYAQKKGETGGLLYFELSPIMPDIVLKDLIKIAHPELLPDYNCYFFDQL